MENSKFVKIILAILTGIMLVAIGVSGTNYVSAADGNGTNYADLGAVLNGTNNTTTNNATANNTTSNSTANGTNSSNSTSNTLNTSALRNTINTANTVTTTNTTTLPKTGIANSTPVVILIAIFGISAVYAYKKIRDYKSL